MLLFFITWEIVLWPELNVKMEENQVHAIQQARPCVKYICTENIGVKCTKMVWLIALQPQAWLICILCSPALRKLNISKSVTKNKILYVFRTLAFTKCFPKVIFCGLNSFLKYAWQGFFYSCFVDEFTNLREVVWLRVIHWYLQGIGSRTPCKYQNPWIPRAFIGNGIVSLWKEPTHILLCTGDPWMAWVWTLRVYLDFFSLSTTYWPHNPWLVESTDAESHTGRADIKLYADFLFLKFFVFFVF